MFYEKSVKLFLWLYQCVNFLYCYCVRYDKVTQSIVVILCSHYPLACQMFDNLITYDLEQGLLESYSSFRHIFSYFSHEWKRFKQDCKLSPIIICTDVLPNNLEDIIRITRPCVTGLKRNRKRESYSIQFNSTYTESYWKTK